MSIDRNKATELLGNYRYYKFAIRDYENPYINAESLASITEQKYEYAAPARVTLFSDMPIGRGSGSRMPTLTGEWGINDHIQYNAVKYAVQRVDCALDLLSDEERSVITLKWVDELTLQQIADRKRYSRDWAKKIHRKALGKLAKMLMFDYVPQVDKIPVA